MREEASDCIHQTTTLRFEQQYYKSYLMSRNDVHTRVSSQGFAMMQFQPSELTARPYHSTARDHTPGAFSVDSGQQSARSTLHQHTVVGNERRLMGHTFNGRSTAWTQRSPCSTHRWATQTCSYSTPAGALCIRRSKALKGVPLHF
jgi:hypothetical protein